MLMFYGHFWHKVGQMDRVTSTGNGAKWKMKHLSDIAGLGFERMRYRYVANRAASYATEAPQQ